MRFQTSNKVVVSVFLIGTLFPALFSRLSVQYVLLFLNKKSNCKYNNYYFHLYFHKAWGSTRVPLHTMSVSATNCRRLCQCFLQKHCFGCSGLIAVPVFLLRKILVSIQQFRGGQCFPYVKHWLPFAWGSVLPYRKHCFPFECFSFAFRSAVQDGAVFPLTLQNTFPFEYSPTKNITFHLAVQDWWSVFLLAKNCFLLAIQGGSWHVFSTQHK